MKRTDPDRTQLLATALNDFCMLQTEPFLHTMQKGRTLV